MTIMLFAQQLGRAPAVKEIAMSRRWQTYDLALSGFGEHSWYDVVGLLLGVTAPGPLSRERDDVRLE